MDHRLNHEVREMAHILDYLSVIYLCFCSKIIFLWWLGYVSEYASWWTGKGTHGGWWTDGFLDRPWRQSERHYCRQRKRQASRCAGRLAKLMSMHARIRTRGPRQVDASARCRPCSGRRRRQKPLDSSPVCPVTSQVLPASSIHKGAPSEPLAR